MAEFDKQLEKLDQATREAEQLIEGGGPPSTDLVRVKSSAPAVRKQMARTKMLAEAKQQEVEHLEEEVRAELDRRMAELQERVAPLQKMINELEEGIWTVQLYLGQTEEIVRLADGEAAPAEEPVVIRQLVLSMDEECAVAAEEGGINAVEVEAFDEWVTADPAHLDQILPERKGVVALRPRGGDEERQQRYVDRKENRHTYFLIRNGEKLHRLWVDFSVDERLVPAADEFTDFFRRRRYNWSTQEDEYEAIDPDDPRYEEAMERAGRHQRDFMRVGLILQGLTDRTPLFHPLPPKGLNFLDAASHQEGRIRFVMDAERSLGTGSESFAEWRQRINSELRPGMRIIGAFNSSSWRQHEIREGHYAGEHRRLHPPRSDNPESYVPHLIEERKSDGALVLRYDRQVWDEWHGRRASTRASAKVYPTDKCIIAIDFAEVEEMEAFLRSRTERHEYLDMFPLLKAAIKVKKEEAAAEAPFKKLLRGEIAKTHGVSAEEAAAAVEELVPWWKLKNRIHRPLVGKDDRLALKQIVEEFELRRRLDERATPAELLARLQRDHPDALLIARKSDGYHVVLEPADDRDVYVHICEYTKTGLAHKVKEWRLVPPSWQGWRVFYTSSRWKRWRRGASVVEYPTGPEEQAIVEQLRESATAPVIAVTYELRSRQFEVWMLPDFPSIPRLRLLTEQPRDPNIPAKDWNWTRGPDRKARLESIRYGGESEHQYSGKAPWEPSERARYGERRRLLFHDPEVEAKLKAWYAKAEAAKEKARPLEDLSHLAHGSISKQWRVAEEEKLRLAFMEEYGDMTLWEGHRKTLDDPEFGSRWWALDFIDRLIESGVDLEGMSVAEAAEKAGARVPDGCGELRFDLTPEPEEDEEDDEDF